MKMKRMITIGSLGGLLVGALMILPWFIGLVEKWYIPETWNWINQPGFIVSHFVYMSFPFPRSSRIAWGIVPISGVVMQWIVIGGCIGGLFGLKTVLQERKRRD
jgi:hypothetical protein